MARPQIPSLERLRVVQLIPILRVGGLERVGTTLAIALHDRVERVVVCSKGGDPFEQILRDADVPVLHIPRPTPRLPQLAKSAFALARTLRHERPHVIHAHNPSAALAAFAARRIAHLPRIGIVTTYHGVMPDRVSRAARAMATGSDLVVGVGPSSTDALLRGGLDPARARTVHNAVAPIPTRDRDDVRREFDALDADLIVTVGRYVPEKNQALLLDAVARLRADHPRLRLLIVGHGVLEQDLRAHVAALGLEQVATITGERSDAVDITAAADVFALSSDSEGLPLVLLEAMALGTPVVSTDAGGVRDAIVDGVTGLLVPVGDVSRLAEGVHHLLTDRELAARLSNEARSTLAETSSTTTMTDQYLELYLEAVALRRATT